MQTDSALLEVTALHAGYGRAEVLHGINLRADRGQVITVIGPNGAGKSTLLNALMGVLPSTGGIAYRGRNLHGVALEERVMQGMALVPETRALFGTMTVEDNLELGAYRRARAGHKDTRATMESVFTLFPRLKERRTQLAGYMSGGEQQMLAIGRAVMACPKLLLLDEPSLGLAPLLVRKILEVIATINREGVSVLLVEQNANAALSLASRGYVMEHGEITLQDSAQTLLHNPAVKAAYLGG